MRADQEDVQIFGAQFKSGKFSHSRKVLTGAANITYNGSLVNFFDASGSSRDVVMPVTDDGRFYVVGNVGVANNLLVKDASGTLITTLLPADTALLFSSESEWVALRGWAALGIFTNTVNGLVPAPNSAVPGSLFLRDDGQWAQVQVTGIVDAFKFMTDGTNTAIGAGPDTFRFRSSSGKISAVVTNNEAVFGDNVNLSVVEANVNHDALLNFVNNEHIDHTAVTLTAGIGLSGGGDISASRTFNLDLNDLTTDTPVLADTIAFYDVSGADTNKATLTTINGILDHNALLNYVANQHIDHSGVSIVAGTGLSGGGNITTSRTLSLDINSLSTDTIATGDFFAFYDISGGDHNKLTLATLNSTLDHNSLTNYVANQHIDHTTVTLTAGAGLTGGGTIAANRTFDIGAGVGITVNADDIAINITGLTAVSPSVASGDEVAIYDVSASAIRKTTVGALGGGRETLTSARTYYVRTDGSDSNDGLANTAGQAFLTIQKAIDTIYNLDLRTFGVTVQVADGTYTGANNMQNPVLGSGGILFQGNTTTPANVVINPPGGSCFSASRQSFTVNGFELRGNVGVLADIGGLITVGTAMRFGACTAYQIYATGGKINAGNYSIVGNAINHIQVENNGTFTCTSSTITLSGTPAFSGAFCSAGAGGIASVFLNTYSGSATGSRYSTVNGGFINTNGGGATYLPGNAAGSGTNFGASPWGLYV